MAVEAALGPGPRVVERDEGDSVQASCVVSATLRHRDGVLFAMLTGRGSAEDRPGHSMAAKRRAAAAAVAEDPDGELPELLRATLKRLSKV